MKSEEKYIHGAPFLRFSFAKDEGLVFFFFVSPICITSTNKTQFRFCRKKVKVLKSKKKIMKEEKSYQSKRFAEKQKGN